MVEDSIADMPKIGLEPSAITYNIVLNALVTLAQALITMLYVIALGSSPILGMSAIESSTIFNFPAFAATFKKRLKEAPPHGTPAFTTCFTIHANCMTLAFSIFVDYRRLPSITVIF
jgi:hypothetical protein